MSRRPIVAVIGAGPAGASASQHLGAEDCGVVLIDRPGTNDAARPVETLSPDGVQLLSTAGLWNRLPPGIATPCPAVVTAWEQPTPMFRSFITNPYGCAWHVDRRTFDGWLVSEARRSGAEVISGLATAVHRDGPNWSIDVRSSGRMRRVSANYVIVATGRSGASFALGRRDRLDSLGLTGGWGTPSPNGGSELLVEATPNGWWYSAPAGSNRVFAGLITDAISLTRGRRDRTIETSQRGAPLTFSRVATFAPTHLAAVVSSALVPAAGPAWIAIGDAALARDPLSGDGLANAFRTGREAARAIVRHAAGEANAFECALRWHIGRLRTYMTQRTSSYEAARRRWPMEHFWCARGDPGPFGTSPS